MSRAEAAPDRVSLAGAARLLEDPVVVAAHSPSEFDESKPILLAGQDFADRKFDWYRWMLEEAPVCTGKISVMKIQLLSRYEDCRDILSDPRFIRNRGRAKGKGDSPLPFPLPRSIAALSRSMILEDDPAHRRLRSLVNKAFTPHAVERLTDRVSGYAHEVLDGLGVRQSIDLLEDYARPIPSLVIGEMVGVTRDEVGELQRGMGVLTKGFSGLSILRTLLWDLRATNAFVRQLITRKRHDPGEDMLSALIHAEEEGDQLSEDELVAMVFLLIVAGFETTLHLITNAVHTLLEHPNSRERVIAQPELWDSAIQEIVRFRGPIHGTKLMYPTEDVTLHGVTIRKGSAVMPLVGAANLDPRAFDAPERFDIERSPNHHLGFGFGPHFCLGRQLALMETRVALETLFDHAPNLRLAVDASELRIAPFPGWHRYRELPVLLR